MLISEYPFQPKISSETFEAAKTWMIENKGHCSETANFGIFSGPTDPHENLRRACHAGIMSPGVENRDCVATFLQTDCQPQASETDMKFFLNWLLTESFAARFILNADDHEFCYNYGIIISADIPTPLLQNICIISRHFYEVGLGFKPFREMVSSGMNYFLAYYLAFSSSAWKYLQTNHSVLNTQNVFTYNHRAWGFCSLAQLRNLQVGDFKRLSENDKTYRVCSNYSGGTLYGGSSNNINQQNDWLVELMRENGDLRDRLAKVRHVPVEAYKPPNPFVRNTHNAKPTIYSVSYKELIEVVVPFIISNGGVI